MNSWFLERRAKFYSVLSRENSTVAIRIFCVVSFEIVARGLDDISNNPLKCLDVSGIRLLFNPLDPKSDQHQYSPNNINTSRVKVLRITKLITKRRTL